MSKIKIDALKIMSHEKLFKDLTYGSTYSYYDLSEEETSKVTLYLHEHFMEMMMCLYNNRSHKAVFDLTKTKMHKSDYNT